MLRPVHHFLLHESNLASTEVVQDDGVLPIQSHDKHATGKQSYEQPVVVTASHV